MAFTWTAQFDADSKTAEQVSRFRTTVAKIILRILLIEQPLSIFIPEFEEWRRSLFFEIGMRGAESLQKYNRVLSQLPGNPFRLTDDCDDTGE